MDYIDNLIVIDGYFRN